MRFVAVLGALLVVAGCSSVPSPRAVSSTSVDAQVVAGTPTTGDLPLRTVGLDDGGVVQVYAGDRVRVVGPDGTLAGASWCGGNGFDYDTIVEFWWQVQDSLRSGDRSATADLMHYPFRWNRSGSETIESRVDLLNRFDEVFAPAVVDEILQHDPARPSCRYSGFMAGNGVAWGFGKGDNFSTYRIITINGDTK